MNIKNIKSDEALLSPDYFDHLSDTQWAWLAGLIQAEAYLYIDARVRSQSKDPDYTPPPGIPTIKLDMIEEDLMTYMGSSLIGENVYPLKRQTQANNQVFRLTMQKRAKTELFLRKILPYVIGEKTSSKIKEMLKVCDQYNDWLADGGRTKAAKLAARKK